MLWYEWLRERTWMSLVNVQVCEPQFISACTSQQIGCVAGLLQMPFACTLSPGPTASPRDDDP
jgi:hypothetical protein